MNLNPTPFILAVPVWYFFDLKGLAIYCIIVALATVFLPDPKKNDKKRT